MAACCQLWLHLPEQQQNALGSQIDHSRAAGSHTRVTNEDACQGIGMLYNIVQADHSGPERLKHCRQMDCLNAQQ